MAGDRDFLNRLVNALGAFDDTALAAVASVGLVRRARKDLEKETISVESGEASVTIRVGDGVVTMTGSGPADARCTCPAGGKCRHVLMATMHLKETAAGSPSAQISPAAAAPAMSAKDEILALTEDALAKWVGRKTLREAARLIDGLGDVEIIEDGAVTVRFPSSSIECRYFPGTGLAGMASTAPSKLRDRFMAAAIIGYQRHHGIVHPIDPGAPAAKSIDPPRTAAEIVQSAIELMEEMVTVGIAHLSGSARDRLQTLSVSCIGGNLPRLSLALKSLADEVSKMLRRDASADDARLFTMLARTYALCSAIAQAGDSAPADLIGRGRSRYDQAGSMELTGVGAYVWRTRSGYHGLTVLFWDSAAKQLCSWSDSRPATQDPSFTPASRYDQDLPWQGSGSPRMMSRSRFRLTGASRNDDGRLSGSEKCHAALLDDADPATIDFGPRAFEDWIELRRYLASVTPAGLQEHSPMDRVVLLKSASWGPRAFLAAEQTLVWTLLDRQGQSVLLTLPFDATTQRAVESLEAIDPAAGAAWAILGSVSFDGAQLRLFPYSLLNRTAGMPIHNLTLDASPGVPETARAPAPASRPPTPDSSDEGPSANPELASICAQWAGLEDDLQRLAESGARRMSPAEMATFQAAETNFTARALAPLATCLRHAAHSRRPASAVLRLRYICTLYRELTTRAIHAP